MLKLIKETSILVNCARLPRYIHAKNQNNFSFYCISCTNADSKMVQRCNIRFTTIKI